MKKGRLEAFSDGVLAIVITIMVLELKIPHGGSFESLKPLMPVFLSYLGSFVYIAIYWNNHHHLMQIVNNVNGKILWANLNLLFWLSLLPFVTGWMGENNFEENPVALYGIVLLLAAIAFKILVYNIIKSEGKESLASQSIGKDRKGSVSILMYIIGVLISFKYPIVSIGLYILVAIIWLIPDSRIEKKLKQ